MASPELKAASAKQCLCKDTFDAKHKTDLMQKKFDAKKKRKTKRKTDARTVG
jgi:hypothetical protein